ncbi:uncharacterized protein K452DRAFT_102784 [Aplosporella prunicola CBS 121167]|uniref:Uncharacterized protein n=1 Tax=Aplosporella prunicola CBS 121167 TaxID=1176127 RepID=A0A6A6BR24_9PEZI|nr:uncharacterized protein K452DRAFT_102784 [Aplosporella prunicola CBS 121167]KAF2145893.1 hypothetical protein K452DRAFT_102784 [Aplosporella prunicola CBS 121167]
MMDEHCIPMRRDGRVVCLFCAWFPVFSRIRFGLLCWVLMRCALVCLLPSSSSSSLLPAAACTIDLSSFWSVFSGFGRSPPLLLLQQQQFNLGALRTGSADRGSWWASSSSSSSSASQSFRSAEAASHGS